MHLSWLLFPLTVLASDVELRQICISGDASHSSAQLEYGANETILSLDLLVIMQPLRKYDLVDACLKVLSSDETLNYQGVDWLNPLVDYNAFFVAGQSPSQKEDMRWEEETRYRYIGSHLVQRAGRLLKMPQSGIMTGQILLQQFYCQQSVKKLPLFDVAMACTLIAGKVEECCRRIRDVVNIYFWLHQEIRGARPIRIMDYVADEYYKWRDRTTSAEMCVLRELGFHVQPRHPIGLLANYLNALELDDPRLAQRAINLTNDGLRTVAYVCWQPAVLACAAVSWAAEECGVVLPDKWAEVFNVEKEEMDKCAQVLSNVYEMNVVFDIPLISDDLMHSQPKVLNVERKTDCPSGSRDQDPSSSQDYQSGSRDDYSSGTRERLPEARHDHSSGSRDRPAESRTDHSSRSRDRLSESRNRTIAVTVTIAVERR
ncbi:hypothetical protein PSACC_02635 [Paramicrosporidium saccamoebae]|uniref:Cyclin-like domain-containing protein n=1 Tax=Paramicrosporidium saccamoebae TaxID=1246581 RepID=A0A2H9TIC4_9FUNG|nr:hypothetical protein PSACC_02635 [Paramicrosporidium saccamoebae]